MEMEMRVKGKTGTTAVMAMAASSMTRTELQRGGGANGGASGVYQSLPLLRTASPPRLRATPWRGWRAPRP